MKHCKFKYIAENKMKKGFTLIESLIVIVIVSIITTILFNMRFLGEDNRDIPQEVVNVVYKEINILLKDFNRNKILITGDEWHEISYFQLQFNNNEGRGTTGNKLSVSNVYIYPQKKYEYRDDIRIFTSTVQTTDIISGGRYIVPNNIRGSDIYYFNIVKTGFDNNFALISKNGLLESGDIIKYINKEKPTFEKIPTTGDECQQILNTCTKLESGSMLILGCLDTNNFYSKNCPDILDFNTSKYSATSGSPKNFSFVICAGKKQNEINQPVGKISISIAGKSATLERCNNDRYEKGIDCSDFTC